MTINHKLVQQIFSKAVLIQEKDARQMFLETECAGLPELLRRVSELLAAFDQPRSFLDQPTDQPDTVDGTVQRFEQKIGHLVAGRYKLLEAIAEGGMGTVWVAEQTQPIKRKVALKLIKPGMDSKQVVARFDAERQALALMDHPNIAKVFDGGVTEQGRPYFAMEYVKGMPLTEYCDKVRLSVEERLRLFVPICQAIQHAHQKGIIHRDLKPSNVLVCLYDGKPVPKVIDFGLAKAMHQPLTEQTLYTSHGLMLGTPLYMSPEQAENNNLDVDTRSDVYSLGVMLYELLTGTTPLEKAQLKQAAFIEILRLIKEVEPPKPSTRVSTNEHRASIAAQRSLEPEQLGRSISGDLDWIIMKALAKERDQRYETANGLARDIERFLDNEPVEACPPSTSYRLRKQFKKHRVAITTAAAFLLLLSAGAIVGTWQAVRATTAERNAIRAEALVREERDRAIENERQALDAKAAESNARKSEEQARQAESQQREVAEAQRLEAVKQRDEAQRLQQEAVAKSTQLEKLTEAQQRSIYAADMNLVRLEALRGNLPRMREILYSHLPIDGPDLRGIEWNYWYRYLTQAEKIRHFDNFRGDQNQAQPVVIAGGKLAAVPQGSKTVLVDIESGKVVHTIPQENNKTTKSARFAVNGRSVFGTFHSSSAFDDAVNRSPLAAFSQGPVRSEGCTVYDLNDEPKSWKYPDGVFSHISWLDISDDGRFAAMIGNDATHSTAKPACRMLVWDVDKQAVVLNHLENRRLNRVKLNRDGSHLAAFCCNSRLTDTNELRDVGIVLDVASEKVLGTIQQEDDIETVAWRPAGDGLLLTTLGEGGNRQKELMSWSLQNEISTRLCSLSLRGSLFTAIANNGELLAIGSANASSVDLIDSRSGVLVRTVHNEASNVESISFTPDDKHMVAFCDSGDIVRWKISLDDDRFALRSRPLPVATESNPVRWVYSSKQDRLAYGTGAGFLSVRSLAGEVLFERESVSQSEQLSQPLLAFDSSGELLAVITQVGESARDLALNVELIDLRKSIVRWSAAAPSIFIYNARLAFTNDSSTLLISSGIHMLNYDVVSGTSTPSPATLKRDFLANELRPTVDGKSVIGVGYVLNSGTADRWSARTVEVRDVLSGEVRHSIKDVRFGDVLNGGLSASSLFLSPNAEMLARTSRDIVELWDLRNQKLVTKLSGYYEAFSEDSNLLVVSLTPRELQFKLPQPWLFQPIDRLTLVSTQTGQVITRLSFAGDFVDKVCLSTDGKRLLTYHGFQVDGFYTRPAHVGVWDCVTGQEILDLPLEFADRHHWDLQVRPGGEALMGLVFARQGGQSSTGRSLLLDATPLPDEQDAQLIASHWVNKLEQSTPVPKLIKEAIQANTAASPRIRKFALELADHMAFDSESIAEHCLEIVDRNDLLADRYTEALRWGKALEEAEPGSIRSAAIVGAALLRLGQVKEALQIVTAAMKGTQPKSKEISKWAQLSLSVEVLCLHQLGGDELVAHRKAIELADLVSSTITERPETQPSVSTYDNPWFDSIREALSTQGRMFSSTQMSRFPRPDRPAAAAKANRVTNIQAAFRRFDTNNDQLLTKNELNPNVWDRNSRFDRDGQDGLSFSEFFASSLYGSAESEANRRYPRLPAGVFSKIDFNGDERITIGEAADIWISYWDKDVDGGVSPAEYLHSLRQTALAKALNDQLSDAPEASRLLLMNVVLEENPHEAGFYNYRAWLRATSYDERFRNGEEAVKDALKACELTNNEIPSLLDTLAAAYAEKGDFEKAVEAAERASSMVGGLDNDSMAIREHLELFKQKKPYHELPDKRDSTSLPQASRSALISQAQLDAARRIRGGEPCWSKDKKELIYALSGFGPEHTYFESLDLVTGATKILCKGGRQPVCSPVDGTIAMERTSPGESTQVWLVDHDGRNERKLADGWFPYWTTEGNLCYYSPANAKPQLVCVNVSKPNDLIWNKNIAALEQCNFAISPDGKRFALSSFGKWSVFEVGDAKPFPNLARSTEDKGHGDWSPDCRTIVFSASPDNRPAVYVVNVDSLAVKLLADIAAVPRWSPDGKTLALASMTSNEILLLDVSQLNFQGSK